MVAQYFPYLSAKHHNASVGHANAFQRFAGGAQRKSFSFLPSSVVPLVKLPCKFRVNAVLHALACRGGVFCIAVRLSGGLQARAGVPARGFQLGQGLVAHGARFLGVLGALGKPPPVCGAQRRVAAAQKAADAAHDLVQHLAQSLQNAALLLPRRFAVLAHIFHKRAGVLLAAHNAGKQVAGILVRRLRPVAVAALVPANVLLHAAQPVFACRKRHRPRAQPGPALRVLALHPVGQLVLHRLVGVGAVFAHGQGCRTGGPVPVHLPAVVGGQLAYHVHIHAKLFRHALQNGIRHLRAAGRHAVIAHLRFRHGGGRLLHRQGAGGVAPQAVRGVQRRVVLHHGGARCAGAFRLLKAQNALAPGVIHAVHLLHIHRRALPLVPLHQRLFHVRGIAFLRVGKRLYSFHGFPAHRAPLQCHRVRLRRAFLRVPLGGGLRKRRLAHRLRIGALCRFLPGQGVGVLCRFLLRQRVSGGLCGVFRLPGGKFPVSVLRALLRALGRLRGILFLCRRAAGAGFLLQPRGGSQRVGDGLLHILRLRQRRLPHSLRRAGVRLLHLVLVACQVLRHSGVGAVQSKVQPCACRTVEPAADGPHPGILRKLRPAELGVRVFGGHVGQVVHHIPHGFLGAFLAHLLQQVAHQALAAAVHNLHPAAHRQNLGAHLNAAAHQAAPQRFVRAGVLVVQLGHAPAGRLRPQRAQAHRRPHAGDQRQCHVGQIACNGVGCVRSKPRRAAKACLRFGQVLAALVVQPHPGAVLIGQNGFLVVLRPGLLRRVVARQRRLVLVAGADLPVLVGFKHFALVGQASQFGQRMPLGAVVGCLVAGGGGNAFRQRRPAARRLLCQALHVAAQPVRRAPRAAVTVVQLPGLLVGALLLLAHPGAYPLRRALCRRVAAPRAALGVPQRLGFRVFVQPGVHLVKSAGLVRLRLPARLRLPHHGIDHGVPRRLFQRVGARRVAHHAAAKRLFGILPPVQVQNVLPQLFPPAHIPLCAARRGAQGGGVGAAARAAAALQIAACRAARAARAPAPQPRGPRCQHGDHLLPGGFFLPGFRALPVRRLALCLPDIARARLLLPASRVNSLLQSLASGIARSLMAQAVAFSAVAYGSFFQVQAYLPLVIGACLCRRFLRRRGRCLYNVLLVVCPDFSVPQVQMYAHCFLL